MRDKEAFDELFRAQQAQVFRFAFRLTGNREDAEDLAAETFAVAFGALDQFRGESASGTWLYGIALNRWRMRRRKERITTVDIDHSVESPVAPQVRDLDLERAILNLPDPLREALLLVKGEGLTHAEAAKVLCVPVGTVYFRVFRAVSRLRKELGHESTGAVRSEVIHERRV